MSQETKQTNKQTKKPYVEIIWAYLGEGIGKARPKGGTPIHLLFPKCKNESQHPQSGQILAVRPEEKGGCPGGAATARGVLREGESQGAGLKDGLE